MKFKILAITILLLIANCLLFIILDAQAEYTLTVDYPTIGEVTPTNELTGYIRYIYLLGLSLVSITALGALVYGGFTYMLSGTVTTKDEAKKYIWGAISGLVLALAAYLILNTINPDLVSLETPCTSDNCPPRCETPCDTGYIWSGWECQCTFSAP